jgi:RHS repeat-associated protein
VNVLNELTNAPSPVGNQNYDSNGNLLTNHVAAHSKWVYFYDDENHLIELIRTNSISDIKATAFVYDGIGRLRERLEYSPTPQGFAPSGDWTLDSETHYIYDGWRVIQERDGNNTPTVSYTRGNDLSASMEGAGGIGGLLARSSGYSSGNWTSHADYYADGGTAAQSARYEYGPFGESLRTTGTVARKNSFRFSSKFEDNETGLLYYGYRYYNWGTGRWIGRDPIGERGGKNVYGFAGNCALQSVDIDGRFISFKQGGATTCGGWDVIWNYLDPPRQHIPFSLFLVQEITIVEDYFNCDWETTHNKTVFYEAKYIRASGSPNETIEVTDNDGWRPHSGTIGTQSVTAIARYYHDQDVSSEIKSWTKVPETPQEPATYDKPAFWDNLPPLFADQRTSSSSWWCCCANSTFYLHNP